MSPELKGNLKLRESLVWLENRIVVVVIVVVVDDVVTRGRNGPFPLLIFHHGISRELEVNLVKK